MDMEMTMLIFLCGTMMFAVDGKPIGGIVAEAGNPRSCLRTLVLLMVLIALIAMSVSV
ncbi:MAG TPA: hypothetical protein VD886_18655 [Herpetosiphonaceae bacterium]|nr:hypothetical protein [Herpetosiphonaceae bacterium]